MPGSASATDCPAGRSRSAATLRISRYRATACVTSRSVSKRSSLSPRAVRCTSPSSSSRSAWNVACSVSSGPKSSSWTGSQSAPSASRASSANGDGARVVSWSERSAYEIVSDRRARVIAR